MDNNLILATHATGAKAEMLAAAYYLDQRFQVYFPVCQQGSVDFIVEKESLVRIQVKTATWVKAGANQYLQVRTRLGGKDQEATPSSLYDFLFCVSDVGCWEIPSGEITSSNISLANTGANKTQWKEFKVF